MNLYDSQIDKMRHLMGYGQSNEAPKVNAPVVEYHVKGADGKTYGIIHENAKFYIKVAPKKDTEVLAEDYDYIGGFMNRKTYEFDSYNAASKGLDLKLMSIAESTRSLHRAPVITESTVKDEPKEWLIKETAEMQAEINRQREIMRNAALILNEDAKIPMNREVPEAPATNPSEKRKNQPFTEKAKAEGDKEMTKTSDSHDKKEPFTEKGERKDTIPGKKPASGNKAEPFTKKADKVNENEVLAWNDNKDYMDKSKGTQVGSSAPFTKKVGKESNQEEANTDPIKEGVAMHQEGDNINKPTPGTGEIGDSAPFEKKVNEGYYDNPQSPQDVMKYMRSMNSNSFQLDNGEELHVGYNPQKNELYAGGATNAGIIPQHSIPYDFSRSFDENLQDLYDTAQQGGFGESCKRNGKKVNEDDSYMYAGMPDENPADNSIDPDYNTDEMPFPDMGDDNGDFDGGDDEFEQDFQDWLQNRSMQDVNDSQDMGCEGGCCAGPEEREFPRESRKGKPAIKEGTTLNDFGKHPAYQKQPMTLPPNQEVAPNGARDWNDDSVKGEKPYGQQIGSGDPFNDIVKVITDSVMRKLNERLSRKN